MGYHSVSTFASITSLDIFKENLRTMSGACVATKQGVFLVDLRTSQVIFVESKIGNLSKNIIFS